MKKKVSVLTAIILLLAFSLNARAEVTSQQTKTVNELNAMIQRGEIWGYIETTSGNISIPATATVPGASAKYVRLLQCSLNALKFDAGNADGIYGSKTKKAIMAYQRSVGATPDGIAGKVTWSRLGGSLKAFNIIVDFK